MKHIKNQLVSFLGLFVAGLFLAGCSLPGFSESPVNSNPGVQKEKPGSILKTSDSGGTFHFKVKVGESQYITSADILSLTFDPTDTRKIYVGTKEDGIFTTDDGGEVWQHTAIPWQKIYSFVVDRSNPARMFATGVVNNQSKIFRTDDQAANWREVYSEPGTGTVIVSLVQHPMNTNVLFSGTSAGTVIKSTDGGDTWKNIGNTVDGAVTDIVFDADQGFSIYLLTFNQKVYYSKNGGVEWIDWETNKDFQKKLADTVRDPNAPNQKRPSGIVSLLTDPNLSGVVYAGTQGQKGLYVSRDFGQTWTPLNIIESALKFPLRSIAVRPGNSQEIVFAAGNVFYKSTNGGTTWAVTQLEITRDVSVIMYDPKDPTTIYLGLRKF